MTNHSYRPSNFTNLSPIPKKKSKSTLAKLAFIIIALCIISIVIMTVFLKINLS